VGTDTWDLDPCYGNGGFYKGSIPEPRIRLDIEPRFLHVRQVDVRALDLPSFSVNSVIFDPPFIHAPGKDSVMGERFGGFKSQHALRAMYFAALVEIYRVLKTGGTLTVKCQAIIESGKFIANPVHVVNMATSLKLEQIDHFILVRKHAIVGHNHSEQRHARRLHSDFLIFRKGRRR
jgi:tRNA G10  N-methylase Trm11